LVISSAFHPPPMPKTKRPPPIVDRGTFWLVDRIPLDNEANPGRKLDALGSDGRGGQRHEGVERLLVDIWQVGSTRPRRLPACRDVRVLRKRELVKTTFFDRLTKITRCDAVVCRKHRNPALHGVTCSQPFTIGRSYGASRYAATARSARGGKTRARNQLPNSPVRRRGSTPAYRSRAAMRCRAAASHCAIHTS
jgi:hypothetical protein